MTTDSANNAAIIIPPPQETGRCMPLDTVFKIVSFLPPKSIARFRCVCKQWRSLSYDPSFVREHRSTNSKLFLFYPVYTRSTISLYELGDEDEVQDCTFRMSFGDLVMCYQLSNSVHGLVCAFHSQYDRGDQHLLNPFTREVVTLPRSGSFSEPIWRRSSVGLGIDVTTGQYKLARLFPVDTDSTLCRCEVLFVGPNQEWQRVGDALCGVPYPQHPIFVDGSIFWVVPGSGCTTSTSEPEPYAAYVMAFDLEDHKLHLIPTPEPMCGPSDLALLQSGGNLSLVRHPSPSDRFLRIWSLKDRRTSHTWTEAHNIDVSDIVPRTVRPCIIGIRGHEILLDVRGEKEGEPTTIRSYDLRTETLRDIYSNIRSCGLEFSTESLVSPRSLMGNISH